MQFSHFFIRRPIFAGVIAIIITIVGVFAYIGLPISQFPDIVPPTVTVSTYYPGASAETVADTVAAPIEQQINGVDNMRNPKVDLQQLLISHLRGIETDPHRFCETAAPFRGSAEAAGRAACIS